MKSEIFDTIQNNNIARFKELIESGEDVNQIDTECFLGRDLKFYPRTKRRNLLELAIFLNRKQIVSYLKEKGAVITDNRMLITGR